MSPETAVGPAIFINQVKKGTVITFACSPDNALGSEYPLPECRKLLVNAVRYLNPNPQIQIEAPSYVKTVILHKPDKRAYYIHCIAYPSPDQTIPQKNHPYVLPTLIEGTSCSA